MHHSNRAVALASMNISVFSKETFYETSITLCLAVVQPPYFNLS